MPEKGKRIASDSASVSSQASASSDNQSLNESPEAEGVPTPTSDQEARGEQILSPPLSQASAPPKSSQPKRGISSKERVPSLGKKVPLAPTAANKKIEELEATIRVLEKKRTEDVEKLKIMDKTEHERERYKSLVQKLEAKLQPTLKDVAAARESIQKAEDRANSFENKLLDLEVAAEAATFERLDAEDAAEKAKVELRDAKTKLEELQLEVEVLRDENKELTQEVAPEEKAGLGWIHMEKENERMREALMRLRDVSKDQEITLSKTVLSLEEEIDELRKYRDKYDETKEQLDKANAHNAQLQQDIDAAQISDEIVLDLEEKNNSLEKKVEDQKAEIDDLKHLNAIAEEMEFDHLANAKGLEEDLEHSKTKYRAQVRETQVKEDMISDLNYTVTRFREVVATLQTEIQDMKASRQISETETSELTNRTRLIMDINKRLQTTASKAQVEAIDFGLQELQVREATLHLDMVQSFLPEEYAAVRGSLKAFFRFKRLEFKANLMHKYAKERLDGVAVPGREQDMFYAIEMLSKLIWISAASHLFVVFIESCSTEAFKNLDGVMYDLEPVERSFNTWLDCLKKDNLQEKQCSGELDRNIAIMAHLIELHIRGGLREMALDFNMRARLVRSHFESAAIAISHLKSISQARVLLPVDADEELEQEAQDFLDKADALIAQLQHNKVVAGRSIQQLDELADRSLTLDESSLPSVQLCDSSSGELLSACIAAGMSTTVAVNEEGREDDLGYRDILKAIGCGDSSPFYSLLSEAQTSGKHNQEFNNLTASISKAVEFPSSVPQAPWTILAQEVKDNISLLEESVVDLGKAKAEVAEKNTAVAMMHKTAEELSLKVETLEKRASESGGKRNRVNEMSKTISGLVANEEDLRKRLAEVEAELDKAEAENQTLKSQATVTGKKPGAGYLDEGLRKQLSATNATLEENAQSLTHIVRGLHNTIQSSQTNKNTRGQKTAGLIVAVPMTPEKSVKTRDVLGVGSNRVYNRSPASKPEWLVRVKQKTTAARKFLAWRAEREKVRSAVEEQRFNQGAWEHLRDDVYGDYKYVLSTPPKQIKKQVRFEDAPWSTQVNVGVRIDDED